MIIKSFLFKNFDQKKRRCMKIAVLKQAHEKVIRVSKSLKWLRHQQMVLQDYLELILKEYYIYWPIIEITSWDHICQVCICWRDEPFSTIINFLHCVKKDNIKYSNTQLCFIFLNFFYRLVEKCLWEITCYMLTQF